MTAVDTPRTTPAVLGRAVPHESATLHVTGTALYTDDLAARMPGLLHAHPVRAPHAHARVKSIDAAAARRVPGVHAVLTGFDIPDLLVGRMLRDMPILARDVVRFAGQKVAAVAAEDEDIAEEALNLIEVEYEELPAVPDIRAAIKSGAPQLHPEAPGNVIYDWTIGDEGATEAAFKSAANVVSLDITNNRLVPNAMEPRAAIGDYNEAEEHFTLYTTSQNPHVARLVLSAFYNVAPEHKLRVIAPDVGGGFGSKIFIYPEEIVCCWASRKTGVPVKWVADRTESFLTDAHGRDHVSEVEMAFDADNRIIGLKVDTIANFGAYMSLFSSSVPTYLYATLLSGQYAIPAIHANVRAVYTNTSPVDAYRGAGRPEATYLLERTMETAARELGGAAERAGPGAQGGAHADLRRRRGHAGRRAGRQGDRHLRAGLTAALSRTRPALRRGARRRRARRAR